MGVIIKPAECMIAAVNIEKIVKPNGHDLFSSLSEQAARLDVQTNFYAISSLDGPTLYAATSHVYETAKSTGRNRLLLAGAYMESHVTFLALYALAEGLDVYILNDVVRAQDARYRASFQMRLCQAGVVPTTMGQFLSEWAVASAT